VFYEILIIFFIFILSFTISIINFKNKKNYFNIFINKKHFKNNFYYTEIMKSTVQSKVKVFNNDWDGHACHSNTNDIYQTVHQNFLIAYYFA
jgi:hypothetical protein